MKGLRLFFMLALLTAFMVGTAAATSYNVFRNQYGQTLVLDYSPGSGWTRVDGPYATPDVAKRAWSIGTDPRPGKRGTNPPRATFN